MVKYKFPRTLHLPWSEHVTSDDKRLDSVKLFEGKKVVVSEKLDGENTTMYCDHFHARSLDSRNHPSRNLVKAMHGNIAHLIPENFRVCGENLYAKHSIFYEGLTSYFYVFSVFDDSNECLSWDDTVEFCKKINAPHVPVLYEGMWDEKQVKSCFSGESVFKGEQEGYVVRLYESFSYENFHKSVGKMVRKDHVQTGNFWMNESIVPNKILSKN